MLQFFKQKIGTNNLSHHTHCEQQLTDVTFSTVPHAEVYDSYCSYHKTLGLIYKHEFHEDSQIYDQHN
jgi:hypothetical protein